MTPITIQDVKVITTQPFAAQRLVIVKVLTSEPGLYGLGCATFTQRFHVWWQLWNITSNRMSSGGMCSALKTCGIWGWSMAIGAMARC